MICVCLCNPEPLKVRAICLSICGGRARGLKNTVQSHIKLSLCHCFADKVFWDT